MLRCVNDNREDSVTRWIAELRVDDSAAAQKLWERYFQRIVKLARNKLGAAPRRAADEEDVAISAFKSFCLGVRRGRFPQLVDRNSLWPLLVAITAHKAVDLVRHQNRRKRGGPGGLAEQGDTSPVPINLDQLVGKEPSPEFSAILVEQFQQLLAQLPDDTLRAIATFKMEGYTNEEIAQKLGCAPRTIERKLEMIRRVWGKGAVDD
jgi:RNA polymerase sigma factor (sigma-70 family)